MSRVTKKSALRPARVKTVRAKLKVMKRPLTILRDERTGRVHVERIGDTIKPTSARNVSVRSVAIRQLPTRPTSLSSLSEISIKYGTALDSLAKR